MNTTIYDPFSVCFNMMKLKYRDYDESITSKRFVRPYDKINVFISLESVFKNLSMVTDLEKKIYMKRDFDEIIISNILNLVSHYKRFFVGNSLDTKVYLYYTDLSSTDFAQKKYNDEYRYYYLEKFNKNPKFIYLTEKLQTSILPETKVYCEFIPNVYLINGMNIEGSTIPFIISERDKSRKNFIISNELYDSQYSLLDNFCCHYINKSFKSNNVASTLNGLLGIISKKPQEISTDFELLFNKYPIYTSLLSVLGDKSRSIDSLYGYGLSTFKKALESPCGKNILNSQNPETIGDVFNDVETKAEFKNNFYCTNLKDMYDEILDSDKEAINTQIVDRIDVNSLRQLNGTKFYNHPIILEGLLI